MALTFNPVTMGTGAESVDAQHKQLVDIINHLLTAMATGRAKDDVGGILNDLAKYATTHFSHEEACMAKFSCPVAQQNKDAHAAFVKTFLAMKADFDRLIVDVETKPAISPRDAVASAGKTLVELFGLARELNVEAEGIEIGPSPVDEQYAADLALPVEELKLTMRSYNCLKREGIHTVSELVSRSEQDLLDIRNFGSKSIEEVKLRLQEMGLALKDSAPGFDPLAALGSYDEDADFDADNDQF